MINEYQICTKCIMDTSDPEIRFDGQGRCNHCKAYEEQAARQIIHGLEAEERLRRLVEKIKSAGKGNRYDCIIGVSGGVDSTYTAYKVKALGLRPLAVHLDNGWDSELAVGNIERTLKKLNIDLYTHVIDWEEFKDLQLSFLKASTPDSEIPTDHGIYAILFRVAAKENVQFIIMGGNVATESIMAPQWSSGHRDWRYIRSVHRKFGRAKLKSYPHYSLPGRLHYTFIKRIKAVRMLDYLPYNKKEAMKIIESELGWRDYGGKHHESIYTRFYQGYILPKKFGYDKRRGHLSNLICSGQLRREEALDEMKNEPYPPALQKEDKEFVIKKLGLIEAEFEEIMALPKRRYSDYPSYPNHPLYRIAVPLYLGLKKFWLGA